MRARRLVSLVAVATLGCKGSTEPVRIATIDISPFTHTLLTGPSGGQTVQLTAVAKRANGAVVEDVIVTWASATSALAHVSASGLVTALQPGTAIITAIVGNVEGEAIIQIGGVPAAHYALTLDSVALEVSPLGAGTHQLAGALTDSLGGVIIGRPIFWSSTASGVARVNNSGLVTAVDAGTALIIAGREGRLDTVVVTVEVSDALPHDADIQVFDVQWTQGVQLADGTLPMIRGGRAAVVNVLLTSNYSIVAPSTVRLRIREAGGEVVHEASKAVVVPTGAPPSMAAPHAQFLVPNHLLVHGRTWEVLRDPDGELPDASTATDLFPRAGATPIAIVDVPLLRIRLVPIQLLSHGGLTPNVTAGQIEDYIRTLRELHPHGQIEVTIGASFATAQSFGTPPNGGGSEFWIPLLGELDVARVADVANADAHWIGVVSPPAGFTFVVNGGFGYVPISGTSSAPFTRTSTLVRLGWANRESFTRELVAHELGHNFGRRHAPCGGAGSPDMLFPRGDGTIGAGGHSVLTWEQGSTTNAPSISESTGDVMGYCSPVWASRYTYSGVFAFRGFSVVAATAALHVPPRRTRVLMVRGQVAGGRVTLEPAISLEGTPLPDDPTGDHVIEGLDATGAIVFSRRVSLGVIDHADDVRPFAAHIAMTDAEERALTAIRVRGPSGESVRRPRTTTPTLRMGEPTARLDRTPRGNVARCADAAAETIVVQDDATGAVLAMARSATVTPPITTAASVTSALRITCSDGVRSTATVVR